MPMAMPMQNAMQMFPGVAAATGMNPADPMQMAYSVPGFGQFPGVQANPAAYTAQYPAYNAQPAVPMPMSMPPAAFATPVLVLSNMLTPEELIDDQEYADIVEDISGEMQNYGQILAIEIPRPNKANPSAPVPGLGKVFIHYADVEFAKKARSEVEGRPFANRIVQAEYMPIDKFQRREF